MHTLRLFPFNFSFVFVDNDVGYMCSIVNMELIMYICFYKYCSNFKKL